MEKAEVWTPTTLEYYQRLRALSPNYNFDNFKRNEDNILVNIKPSFNRGQLDSLYMMDFDNNKTKFKPGSLATERLKDHPISPMAEAAYKERANMGSHNLDISFDVKEDIIDLNDSILYKYEALNSSLESKPCYLYYHGGDYYGGSARNAQNLCKKLAELSHGIVFAVDYRETPEVTATELLKDCYGAVEYAHDHIEELHLDPQKIFVAGDSAGGGISASMSYLDRDKDNNYISGQILIYPMVDNRIKPTTQDLGEMPQKQKDVVVDMDNGNIRAVSILKEVYSDAGHPYDQAAISPITMSESEYGKMPRTMIIAAGYDCLNPMGYAYAYNVAKHRNDTTYLMYGGMIHAFIDKVGIVPQSEDAIRHMALFGTKSQN